MLDFYIWLNLSTYCLTSWIIISLISIDKLRIARTGFLNLELIIMITLNLMVPNSLGSLRDLFGWTKLVFPTSKSDWIPLPYFLLLNMFGWNLVNHPDFIILYYSHSGFGVLGKISSCVWNTSTRSTCPFQIMHHF